MLGGGDFIAKLASMLGIGQDQATKAVSAAVPSILAGLAGAASKPGGADALANVLSKQEPGMLDNLSGLLAGGDAASSKGLGALSGLLGTQGLGQLGGVLSKFTGLGEDTGGKLMGLLAPAVLGSLGKQTQGMGAAGIAGFLASQKDSIASALPDGLGKMLSGSVPGLGGVLGHAADSASRAVHQAADTTRSAAPSVFRWLVLLLFAVAAIVLLPKMCRKASDAGEVAKNKAAEALSATSEGGRFLTEATGLIAGATESVASITDAASAEAAVPTLREVAGKVGGLEAALAKLPASVQDTVRDGLRPLIAKLREAADKVLGIPLVGARVKPVLDEIFGHLERLAPSR